MLRASFLLANVPRTAARMSFAVRTTARPGSLTFARYKSGRPSHRKQDASTLEQDWKTTDIDYGEVKLKTESPSPSSYLIDVREPDEVVQGMIPSAVNVPLTVLADSLHLSPEDFNARHGFTKPKSSQEITFYCRSGKRSATASDIAKRNGYTNVLNYAGSWLDWVEREGKK